MARIAQLALGVIVLLWLAPQFIRHYARSKLPAPDAMWAVDTKAMTPHVNPHPHDSRWRGPEYEATGRDRYFFQWWNYIVYDAVTHEHFSFIYQITHYGSKSNISDTAHAAMASFYGNDRQDAMSHFIPFADLTIENAADLKFKVDGKEGHPFAHVFEQNGDVIHATAKFDADHTVSKKAAAWDLKFYRVQGVFANADVEEGNKGDLCTVVSTLYSFNSEVEGWIFSQGRNFTFTRTPRFRAYGAGSWGCDLPHGNPPVEYPWTWFWITIPNEDRSKEISMIAGTGKFQLGLPLGDLLGGMFYAAIGPEMVTTRFANIHQGSALETPLVASSNDGYLSRYDLWYGDWATFKDEYGEAAIPLTQTYRITTAKYNFTIDFRSRVEQYFRACVFIERNGQRRVYSDFRGTAIRTRIAITSRADGKSIYDGEIQTHNAIEYAYEPELDLALYECTVADLCVGDTRERRDAIRARQNALASASAKPSSSSAAASGSSASASTTGATDAAKPAADAPKKAKKTADKSEL